MALKAEKERTKDGLKLKIVNPNAAGIDIAYGEMQVCVPEDRDGENNRCFGSFTCDYEEIARIFYAMVTTKTPFEESKVGLDEKELLQRKIALAQRTLDRLNLRLSVAEG